MKILNKKFLRQQKQRINTENERLILSKIKNPFIIQLFYAFQTPSQLFLVTEFAQGGLKFFFFLYKNAILLLDNSFFNLGELFFHLRRVIRFSEDQTRFYVAQLILALEELHRNHIIYRDLKPENVLLDYKGNIKLCDFGLSKIKFNTDGLLFYFIIN